MKKGISLIVLVITIIVMIIIAGAIIISLNSSNVISKADQAVLASDLATLKAELAVKYADIKLASYDAENDGVDSTVATTQAQATTAYEAILAKYTALVEADYTVAANADLMPIVTEPTPAT